MTRQLIGSLATLRGGKALNGEIDGQKVAVFLVDGEVVATTAVCPHAGGPLNKGRLDGAILTCPWHGWSYDLRTGECEDDPEVQVPLYAVIVDGDDVFVEL